MTRSRTPNAKKYRLLPDLPRGPLVLSMPRNESERILICYHGKFKFKYYQMEFTRK